MSGCDSPECQKNFERIITEHHNSLYSPNGTVDRIDTKIENIKNYLPKLMKKPNWVTILGTIVALIIVVGSALISTGYTVYSSEYRFASKDRMSSIRERTAALETEYSDLSESMQGLHKVIDQTARQVETLNSTLSAENQKRKDLNNKLERLLDILESRRK